MLGSQSIPNGQSSHSSGAPRLSDQPTVTDDRTGTIAAAMKKHQDGGWIATGNDRPFPRHTPNINCSELYVFSYRLDRTDIIEALSSLDPSNRSWLGT